MENGNKILPCLFAYLFACHPPISAPKHHVRSGLLLGVEGSPHVLTGIETRLQESLQLPCPVLAGSAMREAFFLSGGPKKDRAKLFTSFPRREGDRGIVGSTPPSSSDSAEGL